MRLVCFGLVLAGLVRHFILAPDKSAFDAQTRRRWLRLMKTPARALSSGIVKQWLVLERFEFGFDLAKVTIDFVGKLFGLGVLLLDLLVLGAQSSHGGDSRLRSVPEPCQRCVACRCRSHTGS